MAEPAASTTGTGKTNRGFGMGWKRLTALFIAAAFGITSAWAHGPSRLKVKETVEINAPADKVWAKIGNFQDMSWHPAVTKNEGKGANDAKATRVLTLQGGATIEEQLESYDAEKKSYFYRITNVDVKVLPVSNYSSRLTVTDAGAKTVVEWSGAFSRLPQQRSPPELNDDAAARRYWRLSRRLDNLK
jgi:hypothetical protein